MTPSGQRFHCVWLALAVGAAAMVLLSLAPGLVVCAAVLVVIIGGIALAALTVAMPERSAPQLAAPSFAR